MKTKTTLSTTSNEMQFNSAFMKWLLFFGIFFGIQNSYAQKTWDGGAGTNSWSDAFNWSGNSVPTSSDNVVIINGANVSISVTTSVASLTVGGGTSGSLTMSGNQDRILTVNGNVTINNGATLTASGNTGHTLNIGGNLSNAGTLDDNLSDMDVVFNGGTQTISGAGSFDFTDFLFSTSGTKTINSALTVTASWTNNGGTVGGTGTVTLGGGSQTVGGSSSTMNFPNLILSGGTKTFSKALVVSGNLSIASGALANFGSLTTNTAATLTLAGLGTTNAKFGSTSTSATAPVFKTNTYFTSGTTGYITVSTSSCTAPTITLSAPPSICAGATSLSLPYTAVTGGANLYSISGTGITTVTNGTLSAAPSSITVNLSTPATAGTISASAFTVSSSVTGCVSNNINGSVTVVPTVGTPTFTAGSTNECLNAADETYTATASDTSGITYSVSPTGAGTIGSTSGVMNWNNTYTGTATITASAAGCGGPKTATRSVLVGTLGTPTFSAGATSVCQDAANTTYTATATSATGITYSVLPAGAGTIGSTTGIMDWNAAFTGTATITATATGCSGPKTVDMVVTVNAPVTTPTFSAGATALCQNAVNTTYTASATNFTGITYSVLPSGAGTIGSTSGIMDWDSAFSGNATITASAAGCGGPKTVDRVVVITPSVATPSFSAGPTSVCQDSANSTYTATAANNTGISYSISPSSAGTINSGNGEVNWDANFSGEADITVTVTGCNGPKTATRTVEVTATVGTPSFTFGPTTVCQDADTSTYAANASDNTGITYSVSPAAAGTMTNFGFGFMNWNAGFSGTAIITATATGCNGPKIATRTVTVTPTVGTPSFTGGATTVCQDAPDELYAANASDSTAITFSVSPSGAGTIGSTSGLMNWNAAFTGSATITASAAGCNGPKTATRSVTVTPTVSTPGFAVSTATVCQNAANTTYTATANNSTAITYSVLPVNAGTIDSSTGIMDWDAGFSGNATITASAAGCNGPKTVSTSVSVTPTVGTPSFSAGATTVCQDAPDTQYTATATNSTGITYSVLPVGAGTINSANGLMNWNAAFSGSATITASAAGCNGPVTAGRTVTVTPTVGTPSFTAGAATLCQNSADETYTATATNSTGISYSISPVGAGTINSASGVVDWNAGFNGTAIITASASGCNGPVTATISVTINPSPVVIASDVSGCSGSPIALSGSGTPSGGSGNFSVANPFIGTSDTNYTYTYTDLNGCTATSAPANITITTQPLWYLDADGDHYYTGSGIPSCTQPGPTYTNTGLLGGNDCDDNSTVFNPGATDICYNNVDENCDGILSNGCVPVAVNMTASYHNTTLVTISTAVPAVEYTYPGATNLKYRYSITNITTGATVPDIIQDSRYVIIPNALRAYNSQYTIKASAVINDEVVPFAGNTITVSSPAIQQITLNTVSCGATLPALTTTLSANPGLNATSYTFRIRLNDSNPTPTYAYSQSATRFISANSFTGFPLQYSTSYKISVQYTSTDASTNQPVESGYGAECTVNTPSIPLTNLASPICNSQVAALNANISAAAAPYATAYQFRIRLFSDNGPTPTYYYTTVNASRFSSLTSFVGITWLYSTDYAISVQYSILNGSTTVWSGYGAECKIKTPFFPVTSLVPSQCGQSEPTSLTQQLNISPYPGFPNYKVKLEEISGEDVVNSEEIVVSYAYFRLNQFSIAQLGKIYNISVAIKQNGVFGDYDTACDLFTAEPAKTIAETQFKATAYPNPFADNFMIDVKTSSQSTVSLKVYDMLGRIVEQRNVNVADLENTTIGNQYPSGVYNVIISQENSVQTLRVVKR